MEGIKAGKVELREKEIYAIKKRMREKLITLPFPAHVTMVIRALWEITYEWYPKYGGGKRIRLDRRELRKMRKKTGLTPQDISRARRQLILGKVVNELSGETGFSEDVEEWKVISRKEAMGMCDDL